MGSEPKAVLDNCSRILTTDVVTAERMTKEHNKTRPFKMWMLLVWCNGFVAYNFIKKIKKNDTNSKNILHFYDNIDF